MPGHKVSVDVGDHVYHRWGVPTDYCDLLDLIQENEKIVAGCNFLKATSLTTLTVNI